MPKSRIKHHSRPSPQTSLPQLQTLFEQGLALHQQGRLPEAKAIYQQILQQQSHHFDALHLQGVIAYQQGQYTSAITLIQQALTHNPNSAAAHSNLGLALQEVQELDQAIVHYNQALRLNPNFADAYFNRGNALKSAQQFEQALASYTQAIKLNPQHAGAYNNQGITLQELTRFQEALSSYDRALALNPHNADAHNNRGNVLKDLRRAQESVASYQQAIALNPQHHSAHFNLAEVYRLTKNYDLAQEHYQQAETIAGEKDFLLGYRLNSDSHLCDWRIFAQCFTTLPASIQQGKKICSPFYLLPLFDDPALQRQAAEIWVAHHIKVLRENITPLATHPPHGKIRLGYFSADFRQHPVAYLAAELFELHDRNQFEVIGFYWGNPCTDTTRARLEAGFDQFIDLEKLSDEQAVALARRMQLDIAIDLGGHTQDCRTELFAHRIAPIQVNYLGYPGTMGADFMDYLLADSQLIDAETRAEYHEKIAYLPSYQPNDSQRMMNTEAVSRSQYGLPESGIVFCCFNQSYKIMPEVFASWMRILQAVPKSVLWLSPAHHLAMRNLRQSATQQGVDGERIVFAIRTETTAEHLARHRLADLFLDTLPYNAHTTASDALWAGLPLITLRGKSFTSRVASSLLTAIGLPELITHTRADYEALAIRLAQNPAELSALKSKLIAHRQQYPLFNSTQYTRHLEQAYRTMYQRQQQGLPPADVAVT